MNPQTLKYLQKDEIGKVIATGLATLYMNKPSKPVKYLAQWLKNYSHNEKQMAKLVQQEKQKQNIKKNYEKQQQIKNAAQLDKANKQKKEKQIIQQFKQMIKTHHYHQDLLEEILPEFIEKHTRATGVYVGQLNYPLKQVTEQDTGDNAHLNLTADKVINYIGSSFSHKQKVRGKSLKTSQGVTASSFSLLQDVPAPVIGQDGKQIPQPPKPKFIYVPNVVKNQSIHYFNFPKLGSYLAVPIICNQYLTQANFDSALKQKQQYIHQCEQLQKTKKTELQQLHKQKQQFQKKLAELTEKNADQSHKQPIKTQLKQVYDTIIQKQNQVIEQKQPVLAQNKKRYVVCADTLGKDQHFSQQQIDFITNLVYHFRKCWEKQQKNILKYDIEKQIQGIRHLNAQTSVLRQQLNQQLQPSQEQQTQLASITEENAKSHKQLQFQINKLKKVMLQNKLYLFAFQFLKKFRVVKYKQLIQNILFFLGLKKMEINSHNRASLNWREVKKKLINQTTYQKILNYNPIGPKKQQFLAYSKTPYLLQIFDKFDEEQIFKYNIGLGAITLFIKKSLELRQVDVEIRKANHEVAKKNHQKFLEQNEKINQKYVQQTEKQKSGLAPQDAQKFNENDWKSQFYSKHPLHETVQPVLDIDNDM